MQLESKKKNYKFVIIIAIIFIIYMMYTVYTTTSSITHKNQTKKIVKKTTKKVNKVSNNPLDTNIYICDSKNNRIIEVNPQKQIIWQMTGIKDPDDVQVYKKNRLIVNQEDYSKVVEINTKTKKIVWQYGHLGQPGTAPGYLGHYVDDSFRLPGGNTIITDDVNMRVIAVNKLGQIVWQYGHTGVRSNAPGYLNAPNDAMPIPGGSILITNIGNHRAIDVSTKTGNINWQVNIPQLYPSDIVPLQNGNLLSTDWVNPGKIQEITKQGNVVWTYQPTGTNALNHPSSTQLLPNGNYLIVDDHNDRVFVLNPKTQQIVWQYGVTGQSGIGQNMLNDPSGVALATPMLSPAFVKLQK
jgi:outer membrane protein assembly factor BamB